MINCLNNCIRSHDHHSGGLLAPGVAGPGSEGRHADTTSGERQGMGQIVYTIVCRYTSKPEVSL